MRNFFLFIFANLLIVACDQQTNVDTADEQSVAAVNSPMTVYKSPTCGCCSAWVAYLEEEGFTITTHDNDDMESIKTKLGLPSNELASCHTATIDGYLISDIKKLLTERPTDIKGLTAPGMPALSPGMGSRDPKDYDVLSFTESGETSVYSSY